MAQKKMTKDQLLDLVKKKNEEIKELHKTIERNERYGQYDEMADEIMAVTNSFINVGYSREEAVELTKEMIRNAAIMTGRR